MAIRETIRAGTAGISGVLALQRGTVGVPAMVVLMGVVHFYGRSDRKQIWLRPSFSGPSAPLDLRFSAVIPRCRTSMGRPDIALLYKTNAR